MELGCRPFGCVGVGFCGGWGVFEKSPRRSLLRRAGSAGPRVAAAATFQKHLSYRRYLRQRDTKSRPELLWFGY
jgi:hypothetical protein